MTRTARGIVIGVLVSFAFIYAMAAVTEHRGPGAVAVAVAVVGLQLPYVLTRAGNLWVLAAQIVLGYVAVLPLGMSGALLGFLAGSFLIRRSVPAAIAVIVSVPVITHEVDVTITAALIALMVYGLTRLADRVEEVAATRLALAMSAVAEERLRIAAELNESLGDGLDAIGSLDSLDQIDEVLVVARESLASARTAAADFRSLSLAPEAATARALLSSAGIEAQVSVGHSEPLGPAGALLATVLREAVTDVVRLGMASRCTVETYERDGVLVLRVANDGEPTGARGSAPFEELAVRATAAGGRLVVGISDDGWFSVEAAVPVTPVPSPVRTEYRWSVALLATVLAGFSIKTLLQVPVAGLLPAIACLAAIIVLQLWWPRIWALPLLALLSYVPTLWFGAAWIGAGGFFAGALLVALPAVVSWPLVVAAMAGAGLLGSLYSLETPLIVNYTLSVLVSALLVNGLVRLAQLAEELQAASASLARAAVVQERLRAARDLHDLLGHSLAAILLKCELARRLITKDPVRAESELRDVVAMAAQARADMRTVTGDALEMSFEAELESARSVLIAAGVNVEIDAASCAGTVLSVVLREAVTNVLRHSRARHVRITATPTSLTVENDGVTGAVTPPGSGLGNLTTRLAAQGGTLTVQVSDGWFRLSASDPTGLGGDPDRVRTAAGVQLGDDRGEVVADRTG
jgi:signal transduction histidine kinase